MRYGDAEAEQDDGQAIFQHFAVDPKSYPNIHEGFVERAQEFSRTARTEV